MVEKYLNTAKRVGEFLRFKREQLTPERAGLLKGPRRRTPGLRREEVAQLSFVSTTWYTWLEQGRGMTVSPRSLSNIATALQLSKAERDYLFNLTELMDPLSHVPLSSLFDAEAIVNAIITPCYIMDASWQLVAWNKAAAELFSGWLTVDPAPNMLTFIFTNPLARQLVVNWPERAQRIVAELRAESIHFDHYAPLNTAIATLLEDSAEFAEWWSNYHVIQREGGRRSFHHPQHGLLHYQQTTWQLAPEPSTKLITLIAVESHSREDLSFKQGVTLG